MLRRLIGRQVKGTLGWRVRVAVPATPTLGGCPRGLEVWWLWLLLLWLLRSLRGLGLGLGLGLSLSLGLGLGLGLGHRCCCCRRLHLLLEIRRVVFAHVFHQVRFLGEMEKELRGGKKGCYFALNGTTWIQRYSGTSRVLP